MFIICLHIVFQIFNSNGPLVIAVKVKAKWKCLHSSPYSTKEKFHIFFKM